MNGRHCPTCQALVPENQPYCGSCGTHVPLADSKDVKRRMPGWAWAVLGIGLGCPISIVALGLVATLVMPNIVERLELSRRSKAEADITQIVNALNEYAIRHQGEYPDSLQALITPDTQGFTYLNLKELPVDPWKRPYHYESPKPGSEHRGPHVWSNGRDNEPGGDDDVDSWTLDDK